MAHRLSCSAACGIFSDQGSNPCPLHWQADSQPLRHQGSPQLIFLKMRPLSTAMAVCECLSPCRPTSGGGTDGSKCSPTQLWCSILDRLHCGVLGGWRGRDLFSVCLTPSVCNCLRHSLPVLLLRLPYVHCILKSVVLLTSTQNVTVLILFLIVFTFT